MAKIYLDSGEDPAAFASDDTAHVWIGGETLWQELPIDAYLDKLDRVKEAALTELPLLLADEDYECCLGLIEKRMKFTYHN